MSFLEHEPQFHRTYRSKKIKFNESVTVWDGFETFFYVSIKDERQNDKMAVENTYKITGPPLEYHPRILHTFPKDIDFSVTQDIPMFDTCQQDWAMEVEEIK